MHLTPPAVTVFRIEVFGQVITDVGQRQRPFEWCNSGGPVTLSGG